MWSGIQIGEIDLHILLVAIGRIPWIEFKPETSVVDIVRGGVGWLIKDHFVNSGVDRHPGVQIHRTERHVGNEFCLLLAARLLAGHVPVGQRIYHAPGRGDIHETDTDQGQLLAEKIKRRLDAVHHLLHFCQDRRHPGVQAVLAKVDVIDTYAQVVS